MRTGVDAGVTAYTGADVDDRVRINQALGVEEGLRLARFFFFSEGVAASFISTITRRRPRRVSARTSENPTKKTKMRRPIQPAGGDAP